MRLSVHLLAVAAVALLLAVIGAAVVSSAGAGEPVARAAAACADYDSQAAAQAAADRRDGDGDGVFCEGLPCPCSPEWHAQQHGSGAPIAGSAKLKQRLRGAAEPTAVLQARLPGSLSATSP
jgi:hypothetical protein